MSLRNVPDEDLVPGVTRLRHVEDGSELVYMAADNGFVWARENDDEQAFSVHIDDVEVLR